MKKGFVAALNSVAEFKDVVAMFEQKGVEAQDVVINKSFDDFAQSLQSGDVVVVRSYADVFVSLPYFFTKYMEFAQRGISIESITDQTVELTTENVKLIQLLSDVGTSIRAFSTQKGLMKARSEGKKLGRPQGSTKLDSKIKEVERLRKEAGLSVVKACKIAGCEPRTYYRYNGKTQTKKVAKSQL